MRRFALLVGLAIVTALALGGAAETNAGTIDRMVSNSGAGCGTATTQYTTIADALAAAQQDETIFICDGTYVEGGMSVADAGVSVLGPGSTPANDGEAIIQLPTNVTSLFFVSQDNVTISGLTMDVTPNPSGGFTTAITTSRQSLTATKNIITGATQHGVLVQAVSGTGPYTITDNTIDSTNHAVFCSCSNAQVSNNDVSSPGAFANLINVAGPSITVSDNTVTNGSISFSSDNGTVSGNSMNGMGGDSNIVEILGGDPVTVTNNQLSNTTQTALVIGGQNAAVNAMVTKNTFTNVTYGIQIIDSSASFAIEATIGGSAVNANVFTNPNASNGLLTLTITTADYNAEFNNWGLCSLDEIEEKVYHSVDDPSVGTVDFNPFIAPNNCPSATPTPSPTPSTTPTPTASPTGSPSPTPTQAPGGFTWGNMDCAFGVTVLDALELLYASLGLPYEKQEPCPAIGTAIQESSATWGDTDCSGTSDAADAAPVLAFAAGAPITPASGCPAVGDPVTPQIG